ncbi:MAG: hypothetical protein J7K73_02325 [Nanoarchaeota archaeon]|nr:hypothetical protein [Nanoarchaeota archaeon]
MNYFERAKMLLYSPLEVAGRSLDRINNIMRDTADTFNPAVVERAKLELGIVSLSYKGVSIYLQDEELFLTDLYGPDTFMGIIRKKMNSVFGEKSVKDKIDPSYLDELYLQSSNLLREQLSRIRELESLLSDGGKIVVGDPDIWIFLEKDVVVDVVKLDNPKNEYATLLDVIGEHTQYILNNLEIRKKRVSEFEKEFELPDISSKRTIEDNFEDVVVYLAARSVALYNKLNDFLMGTLSIPELRDVAEQYLTLVKEDMVRDGELAFNRKSWGYEYYLIGDGDPIKKIMKYVANVAARENMASSVPRREHEGKDRNKWDDYFTV